MNTRTGICLVLAALLVLTGCFAATRSLVIGGAVAPQPVIAASDSASFFMTVPWDPEGNRGLEIGPLEIAFVSIATLNSDLPLDTWTGLGWTIGNTLNESESVPRDCALHLRNGIVRQAYAVCIGPARVTLPHEGGDFVYVVFTDANNRIARVLQGGAKYNLDATGLTP